MKRNFILLSMFLMATFCLNAQITYQSNDYTGINQNFQLVTANDVSMFDFTPSGPNQTWDFSTLTQSAPQDYGYEDPNNSSFKNIWCLYHFYITNCNSKFNENFNMGMPGSNIDFEGFPLSDIYQHLFKDQNALQMKMYGANADLQGSTAPLIIEYNNPDDLFRFPMTYENSYTDENNIDMNFSNMGIDLTIQSSGTRNNVVDGWGTLKIPNHEFQSVIRVKSTLSQTIHIEYQGQAFDLPIDMTTYYWFDKNYGIPVLAVQGMEIIETFAFVPGTASFIYFEPQMSVNDLNATKSLIYPNPTTGLLKVELSENEVISNISVYDLSGKKVGHSLDLSKLPATVYQVTIKTNKRNISQKVIKK